MSINIFYAWVFQLRLCEVSCGNPNWLL